MPAGSDYQQLLDATITHLEQLAANGVVHIGVRAATMAALTTKGGTVRSSPTSKASSLAKFLPPSVPPVRRLPPEPVSTVRSQLPAALPTAIPSASVASSPANPVIASFVAKPLPKKLSATAKVAAFAALQQNVLSCVQCSHLAASRRSVVFGVGDPNARIMFVGEAPGADEDIAGEPFVGRAGELLTKIINAMGLSRETVYIANILKCRPDMPGGVSGNRKPRGEEMTTCTPWLQNQIDIIQPEAMVALGSTAVEGLLGGPAGISKLRGKWQTYRGIPLMPTYHPAYLLRNQVITEKRKVWEDMLAVMEKLNMPINAKQRAFFTKA